MFNGTQHNHVDQDQGNQLDGSSGKRRFSRPRVLLALATPAAAFAALMGSPVAQAIIMRDGGVCDPIRHMGC